MLRNGQITIGHAKALAGVEDSKVRIELAQKCKEDTLTVRSLEKLCSKLSANPSKKSESNSGKPPIADSYYKEVELALNQELGRKVIVTQSKNKGVVEIEFYNKEDLAEIAKILSK